MSPIFRELDTVVLTHDVPEAGLRVGDLGAIVSVLAPAAFEVEFVTTSGKTRAVLTLTSVDIRPVTDDDLLTVRPTSSRHGVA
ncbi:MAG: DUF4926 domain-containing protein [Gemmatimonadota bacterium]|nr:DUF4926 domain-containing protein [Gemmatimonadota bacterium]